MATDNVNVEIRGANVQQRSFKGSTEHGNCDYMRIVGLNVRA